MYLSGIRIENFRLFGSGDDAFVLSLQPGLTALIGENDAGKTAVMDALRLVLGTRDQDMQRVDPADFHLPDGAADAAAEIIVRLRFQGLTAADRGAFAEYLTYENLDGPATTALVVTWIAKRGPKDGAPRRTTPPEWRTGEKGDGPLLDLNARVLLTATYLRPLRDAERAMSAGRGSRLSQILQHTREITKTGVAFETTDPHKDPSQLSVLGLGDYATFLFGKSKGVGLARSRLNQDYLQPLSFANDPLSARIGVNSAGDDASRLRQLLEKLDLSLTRDLDADNPQNRGLGSNNLLFMACELLLLAAESDGFPLLLIEEPEAHLHPQRQLRLMSFLQAQGEKRRADEQKIQIIVSTHSPNLASELKLANLVLIQGARAFPLGPGQTELSASDYRFLERFLDVTKANLFFARGVLIVEGDAENILMPVLARLLGRDFRHYGVSTVNVGGVGLGRYARIFMRKDAKDAEIDIPVACVTDMDVMPDIAPWIVGKLEDGEEIPKRPGSRRRWNVRGDFPGEELEARRRAIEGKASGQRVRTFVADAWTLEYDLARFGLAHEVWRAASLALQDERLQDGKITYDQALETADAEFAALTAAGHDDETLACHVYAKFEAESASKAIAAQHLAELLEQPGEEPLTAAQLRDRLPPYVVGAIEHVTAAIVDASPDEDPTSGDPASSTDAASPAEDLKKGGS